MSPAHASGAQRAFGEHLRQWRQRRRWSQLELSAQAEISTRHLSFVETGRSLPSREVVLRLSERLDIPLRERNAMLMAAGYAPMYRERALDDPALAAARGAIDLVLAGHEPHPALAIDRHWNMVAHNRIVPKLLGDIDAALLEPPINVLRLSLHPQGLAPRIANLGQWRAHLFERLRQQIAATGDAGLAALRDELLALPMPPGGEDLQLAGEHAGVVVPLRLKTSAGAMSFISTTTIFGSPVDVTLQELAVETLFAADEATSDLLRGLR
jgi:transcriptional regulator with XRE-family HTH domain